MRISVTMPDYLVKETDRRAQGLGISRSGYISMALQFKAQYDDMIVATPKMMDQLAQVLQEAQKLGIKPISGPVTCVQCANPCKDDCPEQEAVCDHFRPIIGGSQTSGAQPPILT